MIKSKQFDWAIFSLLLLVMLMGIVAIYSASTTKTEHGFEVQNYYIKQMVWMLLSLLVLAAIQIIPKPFFEILIIPGYLFSIFLLVIVLLAPEINGSHRWIALKGFNLQPSELAKITTVMMLAKFIGENHLSEGNILLRAILIILPPFSLILLEPDLGTSIIFFVIMLSILTFSDLPFYYIILIISPFFSIITSFSIPVFIVYILSLTFVF